MSEQFEHLKRNYPIGAVVDIRYDDFSGTVIGHYERRDGYPGVVVQQHDTRVVHVYGARALFDSIKDQLRTPEEIIDRMGLKTVQVPK